MLSGRTFAHAGILLAIVAVSAALYSYRLDFAPPNIQIDEAIIAINAHEIATTGRDLRGELLPLYAQTADHSWYQPAVMYLTATMLAVTPLSEWSIRIPAAVAMVSRITSRRVAQAPPRSTLWVGPKKTSEYSG